MYKPKSITDFMETLEKHPNDQGQTWGQIILFVIETN